MTQLPMSQEACFLQTQFSPWVKHPGVLRERRDSIIPQLPTRLTLLPSGSSPELSPLSLSVTRSLHLRSMSVVPKLSSAEEVKGQCREETEYRTTQEETV